MKKYSTVTRKGQVTIPQEIREKLNIEYGDKVEFEVEQDDRVTIRPVKNNLESLYGILHERKPAGDHEEHRRLAREWVAEKNFQKE